MKVVFLTLLLGLACAAQEKKAVESTSELSGHWSTLYIASNNLVIGNKVLPHRLCFVLCKICFIIIFRVYDKPNNYWKLLPITGTQKATYTYTYEHNGTNTIKFIPVSEKALVAVNVNVDEAGNKTEQVLLLGQENDIDEKGLQYFKDVSLKQGISEENIKDLTKPDKCVSVA